MFITLFFLNKGFQIEISVNLQKIVKKSLHCNQNFTDMAHFEPIAIKLFQCNLCHHWHNLWQNVKNFPPILPKSFIGLGLSMACFVKK
jgi:hypothetical protein